MFLFRLALELEMCILSFLSEGRQIQLHYKINENKIFCYFVPQLLAQNFFKKIISKCETFNIDLKNITAITFPSTIILSFILEMQLYQ